MSDYSDIVARLRSRVPPAIAQDPILSEVMDDFLVEIPEKIDLIAQMLDEGNTSEAMRFAHQLKGSAATFGFTVISARARSLEQACVAAQPVAELYELLQLLRSEAGM
jgi:HPt (histidine-containing phosphotransfer) domain-containing protein